MTLYLPLSVNNLKYTILTDQIIHTLKNELYASVCNNTVVMWALFIELIVSFYIKITQGKCLQHRENSRKTQGISFWLQCGHPEAHFLTL